MNTNIVDDEYNKLMKNPEAINNLNLPPSTKDEDVDRVQQNMIERARKEVEEKYKGEKDRKRK
jgi:hypothetical protein